MLQRNYCRHCSFLFFTPVIFFSIQVLPLSSPAPPISMCSSPKILVPCPNFRPSSSSLPQLCLSLSNLYPFPPFFTKFFHSLLYSSILNRSSSIFKLLCSLLYCSPSISYQFPPFLSCFSIFCPSLSFHHTNLLIVCPGLLHSNPPFTLPPPHSFPSQMFSTSFNHFLS